jgi:hypothetical protein
MVQVIVGKLAQLAKVVPAEILEQEMLLQVDLLPGNQKKHVKKALQRAVAVMDRQEHKPLLDRELLQELLQEQVDK